MSQPPSRRVRSCGLVDRSARWRLGSIPITATWPTLSGRKCQNNGKALTLQGANADSSRTGQWDNSQAFIGLSNKTYGTLTVGRVNTLSLDAINSYDPMGGSYAFSPLGFSGSYRRIRRHRGRARQHGRQVPGGFARIPRFYGANFRVGGLGAVGRL